MTSRTNIAIFSGLAGLTLLVFARVLNHGFVFDDNTYVTGNQLVQSGVTARGVMWAFTTLENAFWHPVTWLSLMLDASVYGRNPAGWHLTSLLIHLASTLLLFKVLASMTGTAWRSAAVAALFAVHPLHVESVAWVSERKDVLSAFCGIACLGFYLGYARRAGIGCYLSALACYLVGLMAKSMLVTLPLVLLLVDFWPLGRIRNEGFRWKGVVGAVREKIPLLLPIPIFSAISYVAQQRLGAVGSPSDYPLLVRAGNAMSNYGTYVAKTLWPSRLAAFYPHPGYGLSLPLVFASTAFVLVVSFGVFAHVHRRPWLLTGWFWYVGMLVPVVGFVQLGRMAMADRFTYLPLVGVFLVAAWGLPDQCARLRLPRPLPAVVGVATIAVFATIAYRQAGYWSDNVTLFTRTLAVTERNFLAHYNLAEALETLGRLPEAEAHYRRSIEIDPENFMALTNLATILYERGDPQGAIALYRQALAVNPGATPAMYNLAMVLSATSSSGSTEEAESLLRQLVRLDPSSSAWTALGNILSRRGEKAGAREAFTKALALDPANEQARASLAAEPSLGSDR